MASSSITSSLILSVTLFFSGLYPGITAAEPDTIALPQPRMEIGKPLMQAIKARRTSREFSNKAIPQQMLADLLWAAYGVNRPKEGKRTAPSAKNRQEIDIYVTLTDGAYRYDAFKHTLLPVVGKDLRSATGKQKFPGYAPLNLVYVVDFGRMEGVQRDAALEVAAVTTGAIVQNVYLYCASEDMATVVRGWINKKDLAKSLKLRNDQYIVVAQTVGWPAN